MAENDLEKNADFTQIYNKHHGEEDPIVAAQRYLNIFRQLHIFSAHKRQEFEDTLVKLPLSIKQAFSQLPGGSVLHDFVNELELKAGVEVSAQGGSAITPSEQPKPGIASDISQAKILATALAEAQSKISASSPAVSQIEIKRLSDELNQKFDSMKKELEKSISSREVDLKNLDPAIVENIQKAIESKIEKNNGSVLSDTLVVSPSHEFRESIEGIVDKFLETSQQNQQKNTAELAKIISESQVKLAQIINDKGSPSSGKEIADALTQVINKNAEANRQANAELINALKTVNVAQSGGEGGAAVAPVSFDVESIIDTIVEKQTNIFKEFSERQSDTLGNVMSHVLKETNTSSMEMFYHALETFQKESSKILEMQVSIQKALLQNSKNMQALNAQNSNYTPPFATETKTSAHSAPSQENDFSRLADSLLDLDISSGKKKKKKKKKKKSESSDESFASEVQVSSANNIAASNAISDLQNNQTDVNNTSSVSQAYTDGDGQEWEYVEDTSDADGQEWEYVEDTSDADGQEWEYVEDTSGADGQEWEYVEDTSGADGQEWEYVEDTSGADGQEWEYVEDTSDDDVQEPASVEGSSDIADEHKAVSDYDDYSNNFDSKLSGESSNPDNAEEENVSVAVDADFDPENQSVSSEEVALSVSPEPLRSTDDTPAENDFLSSAPDTSFAQFNPDLAEKVEFPQVESPAAPAFIPSIRLSGNDEPTDSDPYFSPQA